MNKMNLLSLINHFYHNTKKIFIVTFEHVSHFFLFLSLTLTLNRKLFTGFSRALIFVLLGDGLVSILFFVTVVVCA